MTAASMPGGPFGEPVDVMFTHGESINRLWGIPILGFAVRCIFIIPHAIVLWLLGIVVGLTLLVSWIPVLLSGRQARWVVSIVGGYIRYSIRVASYLFFLSAGYPPIGLGGEYSVQVRIDEDMPINRFWGIPILGHIVRYLILIPHYVVLLFIGIGAAVLFFVTWVPVLVMGRQATPILDFLGGYFRYLARVQTYILLLNDRYPPFRLGS